MLFTKFFRLTIFFLIASASYAQEYGETFSAERCYVDYMGKLKGKDLYASAYVVGKNNRIVLDLRDGKELLESFDLISKGVTQTFPKLVGDKVFVIRYKTDDKYHVELTEFNADFEAVSVKDLLTLPITTKMKSKWFDANENGLVFFGYDESTQKGVKATYRFDSGEIDSQEMIIAEQNIKQITQGILDKDLDLYLLMERLVYTGPKDATHATILSFEKNKMGLATLKPIDENKYYTRGFRMFKDEEDLKIYGVTNSFYKSATQMCGYTAYTLNDNLSVNRTGLIEFYPDSFKKEELWTKCDFSKVKENAWILSLVHQRLIDIRKVNGMLLLTSESPQIIFGGPTVQQSTNGVLDFIVSEINPQSLELEWVTKTKDRLSYTEAARDQLWWKYKFLQGRSNTDYIDCFIASDNKHLLIFYRDMPSRKKQCKSEYNSSSKSEGEGVFSYRMIKYIKINLENGEKSEHLFKDLIPDANPELDFFLNFEASRFNRAGITFVVQKRRYYQKGEAQEVYVPFTLFN